MSETLRTDASRASDGAADVDRDAKIEQLLLVGLDHYFASQYEQAINVWTRALFLDRGHARARAYIERARSALAERQRQSEELLEKGMAAFQRGDADEARQLLQSAIDAGAPPDEALAILERLARLGHVQPAVAGRSVRSPKSTPAEESDAGFHGRWVWALGVAGVLLVAAAAAGYVVRRGFDWRTLVNAAEPTVASVAPPVTREQSLPVPRRGEATLARASALATGGHLRDALIALDSIRPTDPQRPAADRLRGEIQRQLLAVMSATTPDADTARDRDPERQP